MSLHRHRSQSEYGSGEQWRRVTELYAAFSLNYEVKLPAMQMIRVREVTERRWSHGLKARGTEKLSFQRKMLALFGSTKRKQRRTSTKIPVVLDV